MLRRSFVSHGHQLIKEPMSNTEHSSLARGKMVHGRTMSKLTERVVLAATGLIGAGYVLFVAPTFPYARISPDGKITNI
jgi:hypothetical protein